MWGVCCGVSGVWCAVCESQCVFGSVSVKNPDTGHKYMCAALQTSVVLLEWVESMQKFMLVKVSQHSCIRLGLGQNWDWDRVWDWDWDWERGCSWTEGETEGGLGQRVGQRLVWDRC